MGEIINIHVGKCGNEVGKLFWNDVCLEHGIDKIGTYHGAEPEKQLAKINVCFNEESLGKFQPRCIFTDLGEGSSDSLRSSYLTTLFRNDNIISGGESCGNIWPKGFYLNGPEILDLVMDACRNECEKCDCLQGVNFTHSLGGGTGSGFGSLIMQSVKEEYPGTLVTSFPIFPSSKVSDCVVEPYNATFSIPHLWQNCDAAFCIDNEALYRICGEGTCANPAYSDLNKLVSSVMCGVTSTMRFASQLNGTLLKLCMNMIPFPANHFFMHGLAPIGINKESHDTSSISDIIHDVFDAKNTLVSCDPSRGRYLSAMAIFRGWATKDCIDENMIRCQSKNHEQYVEWLPDNLKTCVGNNGELQKISTVTIGNNSAISEVFRKLSENFTVLYRRKAYWVKEAYGMDEMEMDETIYMLNDLISIYNTYDSYESENTSTDSESETEQATVSNILNQTN